jgi:DNA-binding NarL/FixJ family response regulator
MPRPVNALIIDDEPHVVVLLASLLKQLGVSTIWDAPDGAVGIQKVEAHKPDVVLLDLNLPQLDGLQVLEKLKAGHPKLPVVVVSAQSTMRTMNRAQELGALAYVLKFGPKSEVLNQLSAAFDAIAETPAEVPEGGTPDASA